MESTGAPTPARVYQDFEPSMEWVPEDDSDTLLVYLPGFAKEQLRVQLKARNLIVSGERKLQQNTWSRFRVEFPVSVNCDLNKISAKFEGNILFVRQPKLTPKPAAAEENVGEKPAVPQKPQPMAMDEESNEGQKIADQLQPLPETKEKKQEQAGLEEQKAAAESKMIAAAPPADKKESDHNTSTELDKTTKTALDNYKRAVGVFSTKLKASRNAVNTIVILLLGLLIGIYLSNSIKSWTKA